MKRITSKTEFIENETTMRTQRVHRTNFLNKVKKEVLTKLLTKFKGKKINSYKRIEEFLNKEIDFEKHNIRKITYNKLDYPFTRVVLTIMFDKETTDKYSISFEENSVYIFTGDNYTDISFTEELSQNLLNRFSNQTQEFDAEQFKNEITTVLDILEKIDSELSDAPSNILAILSRADFVNHQLLRNIRFK